MTDFSTQIRHRVATARAELDRARLDGDVYLVSVMQGELESLARTAEEHHVVVELPVLPVTDGSPVA